MRRIAIIIPTAETARFTRFWESLYALEIPPDCITETLICPGISVAANLNAALRRFLERPSPATTKDERDRELVWFLGDDHVFNPHVLTRLLQADRDVVVPLCSLRIPPYRPTVFSQERADRPGHFKWINFTDLPTARARESRPLLTVEACGQAGMLVTRRVIEAIEDPWFEVGKTQSDLLGEDLEFCRKLRARNIPIHVDLSTWIGHTGLVDVWPHQDPETGAWGVRLDLGNEQGVTILQPV